MSNKGMTTGPLAGVAAERARHPNLPELSAPTKLIHELLRRAGLRACRVEQIKPGESWSISTIHQTDLGTWKGYDTAVDIRQLRAALIDSVARSRLIRTLARSLAPPANSIA